MLAGTRFPIPSPVLPELLKHSLCMKIERGVFSRTLFFLSADNRKGLEIDIEDLRILRTMKTHRVGSIPFV